jgi:alpha-2-macroglobulin
MTLPRSNRFSGDSMPASRLSSIAGRLSRVAAVAITMLALGSCTRTTTPVVAVPKVAPPDPVWTQVISAHSMGAISRRSPLRISFASDVVPAGKVGTDASSNVTLEPATRARVVFASAREIVVTPESGELAPGTTYKVKLSANGLTNVDAKLPPYEFLVQTLAPNFTVATDGLDVDPADDDRMLLRGSVTTADVEDSAKVEKLVRADLVGAALPIVWAHDAENQRHDFTVSAIVRADKARALALAWDGTPIGVKSADTRTIEVPGRGEFTVTQTQALETDGQRRVIVQFSEKLDARQDLNGLVRLSQGEFTTQIRGNTLTLYVNQDVVGDVTLTIDGAVRSRAGGRLTKDASFPLTFTSTKPQVRFVGKGVILPDAQRLTVPFEAVSARAVRVTALQVYEDNIPQFLQVNKLDGTQEMGRVGRVLWRKTLPLAAPVPGKWTRYDLDVTDLMKQHPGGLFHLKLSLAPPDALWDCPDDTARTEEAPKDDPEVRNQEDGDTYDPTNWDYFQEYFEGESIDWNQRDNPCNGAYFRYGQNIRATRNLLASNLGLIAKRGAGDKLLVVATALDSSQPLAGVKVDAINYQSQVLASASTDREGVATLEMKGQPFALIASHDGRKGYLRVTRGSALPVSHFDVGGENVAGGLKGHLYGDRGVWRPGDSIYLTLALQDKLRTLPPNHPVTVELRNPRNQLVQTLTNTTPVGLFYAFELKTAPDALTGDWTATALVGGNTFAKTLKIETVMPNRLKIDLALGDGEVLESTPLEAGIDAQWLSGAAAANLRALIELNLKPTATRFTRNADFIFDDPARSFSGAPLTLFDGELDENGSVRFEKNVEIPRDVPGMMSATFVTRVFEAGGAFSITRESRTIAPFDRYVGLRLPKGDVARDMLMTDQKHVVELATLDAAGKPVSVEQIQVSLYKIEWKWWWDQNGDSLAQYAQSESQSVVQQDTVATRDGKGQWTLEIKYPEWGRYLVRACDVSGGHCTGRVFYIDWPSWAGNARDQSGPAANTLTLTADKEKYQVGDTAVIQLPEASQGRALLTLETGSRILEHRWIEARPKQNRVSIPITADMAPNVYAAVTLVQPHADKQNDRPIRLYGVIPLEVGDPATKIAPVITTAAEWKPASKASIAVSETSGRAMSYTLAVVDEGLLGLTSFRTPNLHAEFYKREALGVATWDLFDEVAGAYGGQLDRLLALGGSDGANAVDPQKSKSRFPPVVKFLGPFALKAGGKQSHEIALPQYVGAVRVMLVAGDGRAYGSAEKSVFVRQPLMILPTLPRVVGPNEQITMPVSVFASDPAIRDVTLSVDLDARFAPVGGKSTALSFAKPEEKLGFLTLKSGPKLGTGKIRVIATSGRHRAEAEVWLEVRSPNAPVTRLTRGTVEAGATFTTELKGFGLEGTHAATLEMSALPPLNLEGRLEYLVRYPHGCLEQTTSGAFPQVYLPALLRLEPRRRAEVENNVRAGIARLRGFQQPNGGFVYWPGGWATDYGLGWRDDWGTTYAGHFLLEAERAGFAVPADMKSAWLRFQKAAAQRWDAGSIEQQHGAAPSANLAVVEAARYAQAYRLFTLALAQQPDLGAMNRLRERTPATTGERWLLASAYRLANQPDAAAALLKGERLDDARLASGSGAAEYTFGSPLRDRAVVLLGLTLLGRDAEAAQLIDDISGELADGHWHSTQSVAFALVSVARWAQAKPVDAYTFEWTLGGARAQQAAGDKAVVTVPLPAPSAAGTPLTIRNTSGRTLYATVSVRGIARSGDEDAAANGLDIDIAYTNGDGTPLDVAKLPQGSDLVAEITIRNTSKRRLTNLALTQMVPAGWEIRNERMDGGEALGTTTPAEPRRNGGWWWIPDGSADATRQEAEYVDIRDDRVMQYFSLRAGDTIQFRTRLNAAYLGRYYLPGTSAEAMYDATQHARLRGQWVEVVRR